MSTWQTTWRLVKFTPWLYFGSLLLPSVRLGITVVPGLLIQRIFDLLESEMQFSWAFWGVIALLLVVAPHPRHRAAERDLCGADRLLHWHGSAAQQRLCAAAGSPRRAHAQLPSWRPDQPARQRRRAAGDVPCWSKYAGRYGHRRACRGCPDGADRPVYHRCGAGSVRDRRLSGAAGDRAPVYLQPRQPRGRQQGQRVSWRSV